MNYIDVTETIRSQGKRPWQYLVSKRYAAISEDISRKHTIDKDSLVKVTNRGRSSVTLAHPSIACDMYSWCGLLLLLSFTGNINFKVPQVYFGIPGGSWKWLKTHIVGETLKLRSYEIVIKCGQTIDGDRFPKHVKSYHGFELLDTIPSLSPALVEQRLKNFLRNHSRLVTGQHSNKETDDTELFIVSSQNSYNQIVEKAQSIAKSLSGDISDDVAARLTSFDQREHELTMKEQELRSQQIEIDALTLTTKKLEMQAKLQEKNLSEPRLKAEPRRLERIQLLDFLQDEDNGKDIIGQASALISSAMQAFRLTSAYTILMNTEDTVEWIRRGENVMTAKNRLIALKALLTNKHIRILLLQDIGESPTTQKIDLVNKQIQQYTAEAYSKQKNKKTQSNFIESIDELNIFETISNNKSTAIKLAETVIKANFWNDVQDIVKNPEIVLSYVLSKPGCSDKYQRDNLSGFLQILDAPLLQSIGIKCLGEKEFKRIRQIALTHRDEYAGKHLASQKLKKIASG